MNDAGVIYMKFSLAQLRKIAMPYKFVDELDLSKDLDGFEDIIRASVCRVEGTLKERGIDTYLYEFSISIDLELEDAVSLKAIPYKINAKASELFTTDSNLEDVILIEGQTLDTYDAVLTAVICNKPMAYTEEEFEDTLGKPLRLTNDGMDLLDAMLGRF